MEVYGSIFFAAMSYDIKDDLKIIFLKTSHLFALDKYGKCYEVARRDN